MTGIAPIPSMATGRDFLRLAQARSAALVAQVTADLAANTARTAARRSRRVKKTYENMLREFEGQLTLFSLER